MSDSEVHATMGGKSLAAVERPRYKSWRKKYRKMRHTFDGVLEENRKMFKEEQKLESIARRLREELDGLMDLLLDLNQSPALPTDLRFDVFCSETHTATGSIPSVVPDNVTPAQANLMFQDYTKAVQRNEIPSLDLHVIRNQIDRQLAVRGVIPLDGLESSVPHTISKPAADDLPEHLRGKAPHGFLTTDEENAYLLRLDAKLSGAVALSQPKEKEEDKHWGDLTAREIERYVEMYNPQSQHNWLKTHAKTGTVGVEIDDAESLGSHDTKPAPTRGGKGKRDLAKQVGDRAVGKAREGASPGAASAGAGDEDELAFVDENPGASGKKRGKGDVDGTYRVKGGKNAGGKGKRKRSGDDVPAGAGGSTKKAKTEVQDE